MKSNLHLPDTLSPGVPKIVTTSFNFNYYQKHGKKFLETFEKLWPEDIRVIAYYDEPVPIEFGERVVLRPISEVGGWPEFEFKLKQWGPMAGHMPDGSYNINFDAFMLRKVFIQQHVAHKFGGKIFWVDADVFTHTKVPEDFLDTVLPDDKVACYLGRKYVHTESGFLGFNALLPETTVFLQIYRELIETGTFLTMSGWHDCWVFDAARGFFPCQDLLVDLAEGLPQNPEEPFGHPFINSVLGDFLDHAKGLRKKQGHSSTADLIVPKEGKYWEDIRKQEQVEQQKEAA